MLSLKRNQKERGGASLGFRKDGLVVVLGIAEMEGGAAQKGSLEKINQAPGKGKTLRPKKLARRPLLREKVQRESLPRSNL